MTTIERVDVAVTEAALQHPDINPDAILTAALSLLSESDRSELEEELYQAEITREMQRVSGSTGATHDLLTACVSSFVKFEQGKREYESRSDRALELSNVLTRVNSRAAHARASLAELISAAVEKQVETIAKAGGSDFAVTGFGKADGAQQEVNHCMLVIDGLTRVMIPEAKQWQEYSRIQLQWLEAMACTTFADFLDGLTMERAQGLMALQGPGVAVDTSKSRSGGFRAKAKQLLWGYHSGVNNFKPTGPYGPRFN